MVVVLLVLQFTRGRVETVLPLFKRSEDDCELIMVHPISLRMRERRQGIPKDQRNIIMTNG